MLLTVKKTYGNAFLNLVRQLLLADTMEYRPIAFRVGDSSNVLMIDDSVEEDMTEFISKFCSGSFIATSDAEMAKVNVRCDKVLKLSSIKTGELFFKGDDIEVLHSFSPVEVQVIFRRGTGSYSSDENVEFLERNNINVDDYVCISSRHSLISKFAYTTTESKDNITYNLDIVCKHGVHEDVLLSDVAARIKELSDCLIS